MAVADLDDRNRRDGIIDLEQNRIVSLPDIVRVRTELEQGQRNLHNERDDWKAHAPIPSNLLKVIQQPWIR